ncbi:FAD:protein FMN transferase [Nocardioides jiangxiensis]|uniref:FAD:protein FMN transferase n=1 Tax=Nocardioides jiangxiensis TaxID=3064524 RepID=A0ABT9B3L5_9ACTN|nr:FAD:protein FMN transferase [Nocardioides sp. WY-20]MDO7868843.1 FAD:protein FMN transferase [Nocardioides sp. WY-20]
MSTALSSPARYVEQVMGLPFSLALRGRHASDARAREAWAAVVADLREADRVFSTWRPDSWVARLARGEVEVSDCPAEVAEVLALGNAAAHASGGAFALTRPDGTGQTVFDPSGVVKGWAAERAARHLAELPETDHCLSAGGDVLAWTADPLGRPWTIGVEDPEDPRRIIARVPLRRGAVATSGSAHRGGHVVDARTGRQPAGVRQVTVIGGGLTAVDIEATSAYALGPDAARWLRAQRRTGIVVWSDGRAELVG